MRRLAFTVLLALWASVASAPFTARPQLPPGGGVVAPQELVDAGPMHRSARAWRVVAIAQAPQGGTRGELATHALPSHAVAPWPATPVVALPLRYARPGATEPLRYRPLFPTGPPRVHQQA